MRRVAQIGSQDTAFLPEIGGGRDRVCSLNNQEARSRCLDGIALPLRDIDNSRYYVWWVQNMGRSEMRVLARTFKLGRRKRRYESLPLYATTPMVAAVLPSMWSFDVLRFEF